MRTLHVVPGLNEKTNGIAVAARLIAESQGAEVVEAREVSMAQIRAADEVWVHSMWLPMTMKACWKVVRSQGAGVRLVRMTHANLDPVRLRYHGWKKWLVAPVERWLFSKASRVVVTCEAEREWCEQWGVKGPFEVMDLKRFFKGTVDSRQSSVVRDGRPLHVLYLGRRHPLKGVEYLEQAVRELGVSGQELGVRVELRIVSNHFGEELEKDWEWCDVLCLPTLSENFGLVVAEALERGKRVITTDGAPVWADQPNVVYLRGFREGTDEERVGLLVGALKNLTQRHGGTEVTGV